jgi:hypothetical protein
VIADAICRTPEERDALDELQRAGTFRDAETLVRHALTWYAKHLGVPLPLHVFSIGAPSHAHRRRGTKPRHRP